MVKEITYLVTHDIFRDANMCLLYLLKDMNIPLCETRLCRPSHRVITIAATYVYTSVYVYHYSSCYISSLSLHVLNLLPLFNETFVLQLIGSFCGYLRFRNQRSHIDSNKVVKSSRQEFWIRWHWNFERLFSRLKKNFRNLNQDIR
jgi:hypothetical protein